MKYIIEGGIDFYEELYKSLDNDDEYKNDVCLITNQPLLENYVTLDCKHKFNYIPLFNDIRNHKKKFNSLESERLSQNEIRCPYCRSKQKKLLPYYPNMGEHMKVIGVNAMPEPPPGWEHGTCAWGEEYSENKCCCINVILLSNNKTYCQTHCMNMKNILKKEAERQAKKVEKQAKKDALIQAKMEEKQKAKEEKQKAKEEKQKAKAKEGNASKRKIKTTEEMNDDNNQRIKTIKSTDSTDNIEELNENNENVVISAQTCTQMIKYGANKGHQCKCKVYLMGICKRHYNLQTSKNDSHEISIDNKAPETNEILVVEVVANTSLDILDMN